MCVRRNWPLFVIFLCQLHIFGWHILLKQYCCLHKNWQTRESRVDLVEWALPEKKKQWPIVNCIIFNPNKNIWSTVTQWIKFHCMEIFFRSLILLADFIFWRRKFCINLLDKTFSVSEQITSINSYANIFPCFLIECFNPSTRRENLDNSCV